MTTNDEVTDPIRPHKGENSQGETGKTIKTLNITSPTSEADGGCKITFVNVRRISLLTSLAALLLIASRGSSFLASRLLLRGGRLAGSGSLSSGGRGLLFSFGRHCGPRVRKRTVLLRRARRCYTSSDRRKAVRARRGRKTTCDICVCVLFGENKGCARFYYQVSPNP